jgi:hypothetical protein
LGQNVNWYFIGGNAKIWNGAGANELWNNGANWLGGTAPGAGHTAVFDGAYSVKNSSINVDASISGVLIKNSYTGTITQNSTNTVTIGTNSWTQAGGYFVGGSTTIDVNGAFALSGGTFTSTSGSMEAGFNYDGTINVFTISGGSDGDCKINGSVFQSSRGKR